VVEVLEYIMVKLQVLCSDWFGAYCKISNNKYLINVPIKAVVKLLQNFINLSLVAQQLGIIRYIEIGNAAGRDLFL